MQRINKPKSEGRCPQRRGLRAGLEGGGFAVVPFSFGSFSFGEAKENERSSEARYALIASTKLQRIY